MRKAQKAVWLTSLATRFSMTAAGSAAAKEFLIGKRQEHSQAMMMIRTPDAGE